MNVGRDDGQFLLLPDQVDVFPAVTRAVLTAVGQRRVCDDLAALDHCLELCFRYDNVRFCVCALQFARCHHRYLLHDAGEHAEQCLGDGGFANTRRSRQCQHVGADGEEWGCDRDHDFVLEIVDEESVLHCSDLPHSWSDDGSYGRWRALRRHLCHHFRSIFLLDQRNGIGIRSEAFRRIVDGREAQNRAAEQRSFAESLGAAVEGRDTIQCRI